MHAADGSVCKELFIQKSHKNRLPHFNFANDLLRVVVSVCVNPSIVSDPPGQFLPDPFGTHNGTGNLLGNSYVLKVQGREKGLNNIWNGRKYLKARVKL